MPELAVSTWSLHRELGAIYPEPSPTSQDRKPEFPYGQGSVGLLDLPAHVAKTGIKNLEICHFHFPRTDAEYLSQLRQRLEQAGVRFQTLLIDFGDITAPDLAKREQDLQHIRGWIDVAAEAGAKQVRIV